MEAKVIIVSVVKSNKSENNVWAVGITGEEQEQAYCKSAWKAMKFAFLLKKQTGLYIEDDSLKMLSEEIARQKAAAAEAEQAKKDAEAAQAAADEAAKAAAAAAGSVTINCSDGPAQFSKAEYDYFVATWSYTGMADEMMGHHSAAELHNLYNVTH